MSPALNGDTALQTQRCDRNTRLNNLDFYTGLSHIVASNSHIWLGGGLMRGIKIPLQDFALKMQGGLMREGGRICQTLRYHL